VLIAAVRFTAAARSTAEVWFVAASGTGQPPMERFVGTRLIRHARLDIMAAAFIAGVSLIAAESLTDAVASTAADLSIGAAERERHIIVAEPVDGNKILVYQSRLFSDRIF
jgi:hypothetical protein